MLHTPCGMCTSVLVPLRAPSDLLSTSEVCR